LKTAKQEWSQEKLPVKVHMSSSTASASQSGTKHTASGQSPAISLKLIGFISTPEGLEDCTLASTLNAVREIFGIQNAAPVDVETRILSLAGLPSGLKRSETGAEPVSPKLLNMPAPVPYGMASFRFPGAQLTVQSLNAELSNGLGWTKSMLVKERIHLDGQPREGAIVRVGLMTRRADIARADFERLWVVDHARLVLESGPLFHRYASNILIGDAGWDGIVEQWFDSPAECAEHDRLVAEEKPAVRADIGRFISQAQSYIARTIGKVAC
jgi:hypothetical protein